MSVAEAPPSSGLSFEVADSIQPADYMALFAALDADSATVVGPADLRPLGVLLRHANGTLAGGLAARTVYRWLMIEMLWLPLALRRQGIGSALIRAAELTALTRGCMAAQVHTMDFQARHFYEKLGYRVAAVQQDMPPGHLGYVLERRLDPARASHDAAAVLARLADLERTGGPTAAVA